MTPCGRETVVAALEAVRQKVDAALDKYTRLGSGCPARLREAIRYSLLAPGKRLRPALVLWSAEACGCLGEGALPVACAVEMVHAYSLIHDDLPAMDDDDVRRGRPTCHVAFDEATAILAGDALLALAFEVLARDTAPPEVAARCCETLARAAGPTALVGGQADDLAAQTEGGLAQVESIHRRKTGAMLLACLELGALVARAEPNKHTALVQYGQRIGLAFQIADDLLDVEGQEQAVGKRLAKDSDHGKLTFPAVLGVAESRRRAEQLARDACNALAPLGPQAAQLEALAWYIVERTH
jgi:geranylgeranyl diphosphate synthase type II